MLSLLLSACSGSPPSTDLSGNGNSDYIVESEQVSSQSYVALTGRAVKGIARYAQVSAHNLQSGQLANEAIATVASDGDGQFFIHLPRWKFRQLAYLELSPTSLTHPSSAMVCDAYRGCGSREGVTIHYRAFLVC